MPTTKDTGYPTEWFHNRGGVQHYWTRREIRDAERHQAKRGITTDEAIGPRQRVTLTVIRGGKDAQEGGAA